MVGATGVPHGTLARFEIGDSTTQALDRRVEHTLQVLELPVHLRPQPGDLLIVGGDSFGDRLEAAPVILEEYVQMPDLCLEIVESCGGLLSHLFEPCRGLFSHFLETFRGLKSELEELLASLVEAPVEVFDERRVHRIDASPWGANRLGVRFGGS